MERGRTTHAAEALGTSGTPNPDRSLTTRRAREYYRRLTSQARTDEAGGLAKDRSVLLLWHLRNVVGLDVLDAYDNVCDGDKDMSIDGLYLEPSDAEGRHRLFIFSSKHLRAPGAVGRTAVEKLVGAAVHFRNSDSVRQLEAYNIDQALRKLIRDYRLAKRISDGIVDLRLVLVTSGYLDDDARLVVDAANRAHGGDYVTVWDINRLGPIAEAVDSRGLMAGSVMVRVPAQDVLVFSDASRRRVAIAAVRASELVNWPGIEDRSLFDLNVRHEQGRNRVRDELDRAIGRPTEHADFLAYHNGLAVVCNSFEVRPGDQLVIDRPSVVNGTQSVIAFFRNRALLTPSLRVFMKLVEVQRRPELAREVSRRSNTQIPVNPRMLMANSGAQLRITEEFKTEYPEIEYVTRPDATLGKARHRRIANDDAAQLLCALFNEEPWLAVKRTALFESENHAKIFHTGVTASHIVLADEVAQAVDDHKEEFPPEYRQTWRLTRLVAVYLVGQILKVAPPTTSVDLAEPASALRSARLNGTLAWAAKLAGIVLQQRHDEKGLEDDYKTDFKNEQDLKQLRGDAWRFVRAASVAQSAWPSPSLVDQ